MKKGDYLINGNESRIYMIVGLWGKDIVLADADEESEEVLIYGTAEIEALISTGHFRKLHKTGIKVNGCGGKGNE